MSFDASEDLTPRWYHQCRRALLLLLSLATGSPETYAQAVQAQGLPSTENFVNVLMTCGAGASVKVSADLKGSVAQFYERHGVSGTATMETAAKILDSLPTESRFEGYRLYTTCVLQMLGRGAGVNLEVAYKGLLFGDSRDFIQSTLGAARQSGKRGDWDSLVYWDSNVAIGLVLKGNSLVQTIACAKTANSSIETKFLSDRSRLGQFTFADVGESVVEFGDFGRSGWIYVERVNSGGPAVDYEEEFPSWYSYAYSFSDLPHVPDWLRRELWRDDLGRPDDVDLRIEGRRERADLQWRKSAKPNCLMRRRAVGLPEEFVNIPIDKPQVRLRNSEALGFSWLGDYQAFRSTIEARDAPR